VPGPAEWQSAADEPAKENEMKYDVTLTHPNDPNGRWSGVHRFRVSETKDEKGDTVYYAVAANFGCGKNAATPDGAVRRLAYSAASEITAMVEVDEAKERAEIQARLDRAAAICALRGEATNTTFGDLVHDEIMQNPGKSDEQIATEVEMRIAFP
jgi:hypothetical protein